MPQTPKKFPELSQEEVAAIAGEPKSEFVQIRVTKRDKNEILACSEKLGLSQTEYLLSCHRAVAAKLGR